MKSFSNWVESEENPSLAGPQHKRREENSSLDDIVDTRVREIIEDLVRNKKGNQQQILNSLKNYLDKNGANQVQPQQGSESPGQEPQSVVNV